MRILFILVFALLVAGCKQASVWKPAAEMQSPHNNIEHVVEVSQNGSLAVDGKAMAAPDVKHFFQAAASKEAMAYVYLKTDKDASAEAVDKVRNLIEDSGMCRKNSCIDGYIEDPLP